MEEPEEGSASDEPERKPGSRYSLLVGLAFLVVVVVATANTLQTRDDGILGTSEADSGLPLPEFSLPELLGPTQGDANVYQDDCETDANPCPEDDRRTPACEVELEAIIRVCDLFDRPLVLSFWFTRGADCVDGQDAFDQAARSYRGRANFLSLNIRDERPTVSQLVDEHGWEVPVGWDRDGAVSNIYRIGVCPTVAFAFPGGIFQSAVIGDQALDPAQLRDRVDELLAESRRREPGS